MENQESQNVNDAVVEPQPVKTDELPKSERQWGMACHLIGLCGIIVPVPSAGLLGTLILWLLKREDGAFIDAQGKEALNFQISLLIYSFVCLLLMFIGIGILLIIPLGVFALVCMIIAAIKANEGISFKYPVCIRFIK